MILGTLKLKKTPSVDIGELILDGYSEAILLYGEKQWKMLSFRLRKEAIAERITAVNQWTPISIEAAAFVRNNLQEFTNG